MEKKKGFVVKLGEKYIHSNTKAIQTETQPYILTEDQKKQLRKVSTETYFWAATIGVIAVLVVVLPHQIFPNLFGIQKFTLFGTKIEFELYYTLFGILMLFPEIWALNYINLRVVKKICLICKYPSTERHDFEEQVSLLTEAGLEIPAKHFAIFEIDPYVGLSKFSYYSIFILTKLKATLSNIVVKLLVKRFLGRYALRIVTDLAGIPIFAFWNAWASRSVIKETRMRVMANAATADFLEEITIEDLKSVEDKIGLVFHYIAQKKRAYNFAMYAYIKEIMHLLPTIPLKITHEVDMEELFTGSVEKDRFISKMLVFGLIIDGHLSLKEKLILKQLAEHDWFPYTIEALDDAVEGYCQGKGLPLL